MRNFISVIVVLCFFGFTTCKIKNKDHFKIITYNVWQGYLDGKHSRLPVDESGQMRKEGIYNWLKQQEPDVVVFQELMNYTRDQLEVEAQYWNHHHAIVHKEKGMGMGITSKYPIKVNEIVIEGMHHGLVYCEIAGIGVVATHLWPSFDDTILDEVNQVIDRVHQSNGKGDPVIVLGDFNALSPEDDLYLSEKTLDLYANHWKWKLENNRPSYRVIQALLDAGLRDVYIPRREQKEQKEYRVDFIFASSNLADHCIGAEIFEDEEFQKLSDHFPVSAEFSWIELKNAYD